MLALPIAHEDHCHAYWDSLKWWEFVNEMSLHALHKKLVLSSRN